MGLYVEPPAGINKQEFLRKNGAEIHRLFKTDEEKDKFWEDCNNEDCFPVVNVYNGHFGGFYAAGVAFCKGELKEFTLKNDPRPKTIFKVKKEILKTFCPEWDRYVREEK